MKKEKREKDIYFHFLNIKISKYKRMLSEEGIKYNISKKRNYMGDIKKGRRC